MMDDVYLLNSPFTFQSMEKHAAYCAMIRLRAEGARARCSCRYKRPPDNARFAYTAARYNRPFDLDEIAERVGYPLFMKPYDGGQWIGVTRIRDEAELHRAYDASGERLMHLQAAIDGYDVFARSLSIGPETMVMRFRPEQPMHDRYAVAHDFLTPEVGSEVVAISRLVNAFFRWEFNSCEMPRARRRRLPHRLRQRLPRRRPHEPALLLPVGDEGAREVVRVLRRRRPARRSSTSTRASTSTSATATTSPTRRSSPPTAGWPTTTSRPSATRSSAPRSLAHVDELVLDWVASPELRRAAGRHRPQRSTPAHEHERFVAHFRGLIGQWVREQGAEPALSG